MKNIIIVANEYGINNHGIGNQITIFELFVEETWSENDVKAALRNAAQEYCMTTEGKETYCANCCCFNIGDLALHVPQNILVNHGLHFKQNDNDIIEMDFNEQLVEEAVVFP